jgi:cutinase
MRLSTILGAALIGVAAAADDETCPPSAGVDFSKGVVPRPEHIPNGCSDYEVLVARGTSEPNFAPDGKFGVVVGDPIISNLTAILPNARGYPVQYPANDDFVNGTITGATDVVARIVKQSALCPDQTFALVGYSQGAAVMHVAASRIPVDLYPKIKALVMFGDPWIREGSEYDPFFPSELQHNTLQNCASRDPICDRGDCFFFHLTYIRPDWINASVHFIRDSLRGSSCRT